MFYLALNAYKTIGVQNYKKKPYINIHKFGICLTNIKIRTMKIITKENGVAFLVTLTAVMVGLAVHQLYVAPRISKKG